MFIQGRKFFACMFMQITNIFLLYITAIPADDFKAMTVGVFGMYVLGNVGEHYTNKKDK